MRPWIKSSILLGTGVAVGLGGAGLAYKYRHKLLPAEKKTYALRDDILVHGNTHLKEVALTIDDGPRPEETRALLSILGKHDVRATFFVVGKQVEKHPGLVRRMMNEGHEVGNHSFNHPRLDGLPMDRVKAEIASCDKAIFQATGAHTNLFRPPGMRYDDEVIRTAQDLGYVTIHWNAAAKDIEAQDPSRIVAKVLKGVKPGSVILLHGHPDTVRAMPTILSTLKSQGYRFVTVSQMLSRLPRPVYVKTNAYGATKELVVSASPRRRVRRTDQASRRAIPVRSTTTKKRPAKTEDKPVRGLDLPTL